MSLIHPKQLDEFFYVCAYVSYENNETLSVSAILKTPALIAK